MAGGMKRMTLYRSPTNRRVAALIIHMASLAVISGIAQAGKAERPALSPEVAGAHHGQAVAAARICPGARLTPAADAAITAYSGAAADQFAAQSALIVAAWEKAFSCTDIDPAQFRDINGCRKSKILSCTTAWREVGPDGSELPGLLEFRPADDDE